MTGSRVNARHTSRTMIVAVVLVTSFCLAAGASGTPPAPPIPNCQLSAQACAVVTVGSGHWGKVSWRFEVSEPTSAGYDAGAHDILCKLLVLDDLNPEALACGNFAFFRPTASAMIHELLKIPKAQRSAYQTRLLDSLQHPSQIQVGWLSEASLRFAAIYGEVIAKAHELEITFTNNTTVKVATLPPKGKLVGTVAFYAAPMPCHTAVKTIIGLGSNNTIVARYPAPVVDPLLRQAQLGITTQC